MGMINKRKRGQGGFTLIELLVAVAILAILAGVAVFAVGNLTSQSELSACKTEAETIRTAIASARAATQDNSTPNPKLYNTYLQGGPKYFTVDPAKVVDSNPVTVPRNTTTLGDAPKSSGPGVTPVVEGCDDVTA